MDGCAVEVRFRTRRLARCSESRTEASKRWGVKVAESYVDRVNRLRAADKLHDLAGFRSLHLHKLEGEHKGQWAINLTERWRVHLRETPWGVLIEEVTNHYSD